ncbi:MULTISPECIES: PucR family transcriptional regulator [Streptomyces]|uniref:PucR family transcriptional regulator n=3 Tax=Streptomyces TaxID=1883 RepID=A0ABU2R6I5_9ACTN|nr:MULTISPECIES: PucR family transcriptional regulator [unclassified Streptomyces]MDT0412298.1 PucR family transcriptional regulator [Streptomyces sp. DSM 41979]MYQ60678.1 PucR family transcriptional regulator [Streptomyces sp. SID4926]SCD99760.1 purine catabolism regulatory protein [Streptomyces sp. DfronAA-171]
MPPTLASLVHHSALKLTVLAGADRLDTPVRWAHVSELIDPVPYMNGGELLLTTALTLDAENPEEIRPYVRRLARAGVVGLGFGRGVNYDEVPAALVAAAEAESLPLLEVPRRTPFLAITKVVSAAIAAEQYRAVTAGFAAQRELTRQALVGEGPEGLIGALAAQLNGWAAVYDASGAVVAAAPEWAARRAARLTPDVRRLRDRPAPASAVVAAAEDRVELHSLGAARHPRAALAVGTEGTLGTAERYSLHAAISLLTLTTERSRAFQAAEQRIGAAVLGMLLAGESGHARAAAGDLYGALLDAPFRLVIVAATSPVPRPPATSPAADPAEGDVPPEPAADPFTAMVERVEAAAARAGEPVLVVREGDRLVLLAVDQGAVADACATYAGETDRARDTGAAAAPAADSALVIGLSAPSGPVAAATAYKQAEQALSVARRRGRTLVEHEDVAAGSVLPLLADDAVRAFADGLLRALHDHDATGRGDLVASLRAWLAHHGQWDAAAAELGVHRHTLRYRMRRVEEILGRSLDDPDVRMELWLALKATTASGGVG